MRDPSDGPNGPGNEKAPAIVRAIEGARKHGEDRCNQRNVDTPCVEQAGRRLALTVNRTRRGFTVRCGRALS